MRRPLNLLLVALLALAAGACQLTLAADVGVEADGSGRLEIAFRLDRELADRLADSGVDVTRGIEEADGGARAWEVSDTDEASGREVRLVTQFDDPAQLGERVDDLHAGLGDEDGAILRDVELAVDQQGAARFRARAGLVLPTAAGAEGDGVAFDADDLAALVERDGARIVRYDLRLTLPGPPVEHDADAVDGRILTWQLPVGRMRTVEVLAGPPRDLTLPVSLAAFGASATLTALVVLTVGRRRAPVSSAE